MNWIHLRIHENEFYTLPEISDWLLKQTRSGFIVQHDADEDVNRLHIHATLSLKVKYNTFKTNHLKEKFPKLVGKTHFGGHDIKDFEANNRYCCKGVKRETDLSPDILPFNLVCAKGEKFADSAQFWKWHHEYWDTNEEIKKSNEKKNKEKKKKTTWALNLAQRLKDENRPFHNDLTTKVIVYRAMMKEMSEDARKLGANNFREIHLGIMNYLCPHEIVRDPNWLASIFPNEDQYELSQMMQQHFMQEVLTRSI